MEELEQVEKTPGSKRKTVIYWQKLLREAGIDWTRIGQLTKERKEWKALVKKRMDHLEKWEERRGKRVAEDSGERNTLLDAQTQDHTCEVCGKVCKSKAGLTVHRRRMHERSDQKVTFKCQGCNLHFEFEANLH
ncbi:MAG: hypothetical protein GY696_13850, partial [Gammaproteobacteria bacterium]|nr:hypothetical protein [Gammaproteobacteria bacterium]